MPDSPRPTASAAQTPRASPRDWAGLVLLLVPMMVLATDLTVLFFAMPAISADLMPSATQSLWITHVYGFLIAGFLIAMGRVSDRVGPRRLLLIGASAFAVLSAGAALATSAEVLIVARALMGVAGATLMPSLFSLLRTMFVDDGQRRFAIAVMFSAFTAGGAIGPLLGGALLEVFAWGSVFLINVPLLLVLLVAGPVLLPERPAESLARIDALSCLLSVAGTLAVVYGLQELIAGPDNTRETAVPFGALGALGAGSVLLVLFVVRQRRLPDPLLDLRLVTQRRIATGLSALLLAGIGVVGVFYLVTQYLQWSIDMSPLRAGLWTLPFIALNIAGAMLGPALTRWLSPAVVIAAGLVVAGSGSAALGVVAGFSDSPVTVVAALAMAGFGQGLALALLSDLIISSAPVHQSGSAAAAQEVGGELGSALGIAVAGMTSVLVYRRVVADGVSESTPQWAVEAARSGVADGVAAAESLAPGGDALLGVVQDAVGAGLQVYAGAAAILCVGAAALVVVALRRPAEDVSTTLS